MRKPSLSREAVYLLFSSLNTRNKYLRSAGGMRRGEPEEIPVMMSANRMKEADDASVYEAEISVNDATLCRKVVSHAREFHFRE